MTVSHDGAPQASVESDLIPYQAAGDMGASHALVLAPHADDEVFGCGGAIASHVRRGVPVSVVILTDGAQYGDPAVRTGECRAAAAVLGYGEPEFWNIPDRALRHTESLVARVVEKIAATGADLVYAPSPWEVHPDHRSASAVAAEAVRRTGVRIAFFEVGTPVRPNLLLDLGPFMETKQNAIRCFASQLAQQDYERQIAGLNQFRSYTLQGTQAAEAYLVLSAAQLDSVLPFALAAEPVAPGAGGIALPPDSSLPLVSILVRSLDRELLREALDSVALQTWARIEVVVVAANPGHRPLPAHCGPFPLRLVQTTEPYRRSRTANTALTEARGDYLLFLDDDDWIMPGHIARLAQVLRGQPACKAAYAGVALVGPEGQPLGQVTDLPFDAVRQLAGNLMPIHAVLFDKSLVAAGCKFDEDLDRFEDWDFWLQIARHTTFAHVPGVSAAYRIHDSSGVHDDSGPMGDPTQLIYAKWQAQWSAGQGRQMMQRVWATEDLEQQARELAASLAQAHAEIERAHAEIGQQLQALHQHALTIEQQRGHAEHLERVIAAREQTIHDLMQSASWRVTAPLRWISAKLRRLA